MIFVAVVAVAMAASTWVLGWWAVPALALLAGFLHRADGGRAGRIALGAVVGWCLLLAIDAVSGPIGRATTLVGGAMGIPGAAVLAVTLVFPALIAWSAAVIGSAIPAWGPAVTDGTQAADRA